MGSEASFGANLREGRQEDSLGGRRRTASPVPSREAFNWSCRTDGRGKAEKPGGGKRGQIKIEPAD